MHISFSKHGEVCQCVAEEIFSDQSDSFWKKKQTSIKSLQLTDLLQSMCLLFVALGSFEKRQCEYESHLKGNNIFSFI